MINTRAGGNAEASYNSPHLGAVSLPAGSACQMVPSQQCNKQSRVQEQCVVQFVPSTLGVVTALSQQHSSSAAVLRQWQHCSSSAKVAKWQSCKAEGQQRHWWRWWQRGPRAIRTSSGGCITSFIIQDHYYRFPTTCCGRLIKARLLLLLAGCGKQWT